MEDRISNNERRVWIAGIFAAALVLMTFVGACEANDTLNFQQKTTFANACIKDGAQFINWNCIR